MLGWLKRLFGGDRPRRKDSARLRRVRSGRTNRSTSRPTAEADGAEEELEEDKPALKTKPSVGNLDVEAHRNLPIGERDTELFDRLAQRIETGEFELPHLPATSLALVNLAGKAGVDVNRVVQLVSSDPSLASELLRISNSVLYATRMPAETLNEAVMRIGLRGLRSLIYTVSVKGTVLRLKGLRDFSEETWRQAFSVATIARAIAPTIGQDREHAFLTGLLHDIGKIALLSVLSKEAGVANAITPAVVGHLFYVYHERAGEMLARKWRLSEELISVTGCHHNFAANEEFGRSAALASLAHKLDLHLSLEDESTFRQLVHCEEMEYLQIPQERRLAMLGGVRDAYLEIEQEKLAAA